MRSLVFWLFSPLSWLLLSLAVCAIGWRWQAQRRRLLAFLAAATAISTLAMTPWFANLLVGWLEHIPNRPPACRLDPPQVAVVLAGGVDRSARDERDFSALTVASRRRAEKAIEWQRERLGRELVIAGGRPWANVAPESALMASYLAQLGVDAATVRTERRSRNTWENAHELLSLSPPVERRVALITSAMHTRRAAYAMRRAGFEVCEVQTDWRHVPYDGPGYFVPGSSGLNKTEAALQEMAGLFYYQLRDRIGMSADYVPAAP
ncbi:YdcF family protein [Pseudoxanthomonas mexicana]|uniref:YdcF family protein n=1 Tax=Pseudoxanthomonas mexicana TaxID=128785 RepID=UPI00398A83AE